MNLIAEAIINEVIDKEGSAYTDHPSDLGGPTKYGITQRALSAYLRRPASKQEVMALTRNKAQDIYYHDYVTRPGFLDVLNVSAEIGRKLVDAGVNVGVWRVSEWFQMALNSFNRKQQLYADIKVDGDVGPQTTKALNKLILARGKANAEEVVLKALNCQQGAHYLTISDNREANEDFTYGWFKNRVD